MLRLRPSWLTFTALALTSGCSSDRIILLVDESGSGGEVEVRTERGALILSEPLTEATVGLLGGIDSKPTDQATVDKEFEAALEAMPPPPKSYLLYFEEGTTVLMPQSVPTMDALLDDIARHPVADIQVTGHTDRVGSTSDNDELARNRAGFVRRMLLDRGQTERFIRAVGRGEREPLIATEDGVEEPRNRRVEVIVR